MDRNLQLAAGTLETFIGGSLYLFGVYAPQLKDKLDMNQAQINDLGAGMFIGGFLLLWPISYVSDNYGPKIPMIFSTIAGTFGYLVIFLGLRHSFTLPYYLTFACFVAIGCYISMFNIILPPIQSQFEDKPHTVSAFLQSFYGLGNIIWPLLYKYALDLNLESGMAVLSASALGGGILCVICITFKKKVDIPFTRLLNQASDESAPLIEKRQPSVIALLTDLKFWTLVIIFFCNFGTSINFFANIGSIYESWGGKAHSTFVLMVGFGIAQTLSRFFCLGWSYKHLSSHMLMCLCLGPQILVNLCAAWLWQSTTSAIVYMAATGFAYGVGWTCFYIMFGEYFGKVCPNSQLFAVASILAPGLGPMAMGTASGAIYDHYGYKSGDQTICNGVKCYQGTFEISFGLDMLGLVLLIVMWVYKKPGF